MSNVEYTPSFDDKEDQRNEATVEMAEDPGADMLNSHEVVPHDHNVIHAGNSEVQLNEEKQEGICPNTAFAEENIMVTKSDTDLQNKNGRIVFPQSRPAEKEPIPPCPPDPDKEPMSNEKINAAGSSFVNKATEQKEHYKNSHLKIESMNGKRNCSDLSPEMSESTDVVSDVKKHSAPASPVSPPCEISTAQEKSYVSSETTCACSIPSNNSTSSVISSSPENEKLDCVDRPLESSSICGNTSEELPSSDLELLPDKKENPPNVFFPKGKIHDINLHSYERPGNTEVVSVGTPTPADRLQWVAMNKKYIQKDGYRLGISPGTFYSSNEGYFVEVPNGINYEVILTNENAVPCNVDVLIDNNKVPAICFRLNPGKPVKFDGPTFTENKFVFLRSKDAPSESKINPENTNNGIVQAIFTPQKMQNVRRRAESEHTHLSRGFYNALETLGIGGKIPGIEEIILGIEERVPRRLRSCTTSCVERGVNITNFCQGATALRGEQSPKNYKKADSMDVDETKRVPIRLRLVARIDDPSVPSEEDICSLYPPSVEELLKS